MAVAHTRLLVLGMVSICEPMNGYQIRRELMSWYVDEWAKIKPGSIYSALSTLTSRGHLERHDLNDGTRGVAVYTMTAQGRAELRQMHGDAVEEVDVLSPVGFHAALSLAPTLARSEILAHLRKRRQALLGQLEVAEERARMVERAHVAAMVGLWEQVARAELAWLESFITDIDDGGYVFAGEEAGQSANNSESGRQLDAERKQYRQILGLD